jgi:hypothetical protein
MYAINILQIIHRRLPWFLRSERMVAWLWSLMYPLHQLSVQWYGFTATRRRAARYNGQVIVLERALNLRYMLEDKWATDADPTASGGIYIENVASAIPTTFIWSNNEAQPPLYIYGDAEAQPPVYIYADAEYSAQYDFIVRVPVAFSFDVNEMTAFVNQYRVAGKTFTIDTY